MSHHILILLNLLSISFLLLRDSLHLIDKLTLAHVMVVSLDNALLTTRFVEFVLFVYNAQAEG